MLNLLPLKINVSLVQLEHLSRLLDHLSVSLVDQTLYRMLVQLLAHASVLVRINM